MSIDDLGKQKMNKETSVFIAPVLISFPFSKFLHRRLVLIETFSLVVMQPLRVFLNSNPNRRNAKNTFKSFLERDYLFRG